MQTFQNCRRPVLYGSLGDHTPYVRRRHLRSYYSLGCRNNRGRFVEAMVVEDCRIQRILRTAKAKLGDREKNSRRSHLEHGCMKNRDVRLGGLISGERRSGQPKVNNYGEEGWVFGERNRSDYESRAVRSRRDPRGSSALWIVVGY